MDNRQIKAVLEKEGKVSLKTSKLNNRKHEKIQISKKQEIIDVTKRKTNIYRKGQRKEGTQKKIPIKKNTTKNSREKNQKKKKRKQKKVQSFSIEECS